MDNEKECPKCGNRMGIRCIKCYECGHDYFDKTFVLTHVPKKLCDCTFRDCPHMINQNSYINDEDVKFIIKPLTIDYIKELGFKHTDTVRESDFYYNEYTIDNLSISLTVYFNYWKDGRETYDVDFDGYDLVNVGEQELKNLLNIIPKT